MIAKKIRGACGIRKPASGNGLEDVAASDGLNRDIGNRKDHRDQCNQNSDRLRAVNVGCIVGNRKIAVALADKPEAASPDPEKHARKHRPQTVAPPADSVVVCETAAPIKAYALW